MKSHRSIFFLFLVLPFAQAVAGQTATRSITIQTEPDAIVWLNGVRYGTTDKTGRLEIGSAPGGKQTVRVRANGFSEASKALPATQKGNVEILLIRTTDEAVLAYQEAEKLSTVDRSKAAAAYQKAIKLKPSMVEAHIGLARTLSEAGDFEGANKAIRQAVRLAPRNAEAAAVDGRIQKLSGDETKSVAAFKKAIANGGGFQPEAFTGLAVLYQERAEAAAGEGNTALETSNYAESAKYFATAVKQLGTSLDAPTVYQLLGLVYEQQKKYKEAIALYEEFLRLFPKSVEAEAVRSFIVQLKKQMSEQD